MDKLQLKKGSFNIKTSIKWRIMLTFFIVVFISLTVAGVFVTNALKTYQINYVRTNCEKTADMIKVSMPFKECKDLGEKSDTIRAILEEWQTGKDYEVFIIDKELGLIASDNNTMVGRSAIGSLDDEVVIKAVEGEEAESRGVLNNGVNILNYAVPIEGQDKNIIGVIYIRANLTSVYDMESATRRTFVQAMIIAIVVTLLLSFFITSSITEPINDLTQKAEKMASGDFSQKIAVRSDDEIGRLADMFNILRQELDNKITEIFNENNKLETILKYMADGLIATDLYGGIIHINPAAAELLEITTEELSELDFGGIMNRIGKKDLADGINIATSREVISEVLVYENKALHIRYVRIVDDEKNDIGVIMLIQDITERQRLEQMQSDFVANVSHELRTPLTTIKSYSETLACGSVTDEDTMKRFLGIIDDEAERMTHLVKDLLQLSSLDNNARMNMRTLNINTLMADCAEKIRFTAQAKNQTVICDFDINEILHVTADRDRMMQVILNVLTNAIKYTPEDGIIRMDTRNKGDTVHIVITDNGIGIGKEELPRIFERFFRVDKARSRDMGGTGLGLSIARQIVEAHNGSITADSVKGRGTEITIVLPLLWNHGECSKDQAAKETGSR